MQLRDLAARAGYGTGDVLVVGVRHGDAPATFHAAGDIGPATVAYSASLSKQMTAACAALLVRRGALDTGSALSRWMPELPAWAATVRVHHLIHHTGGLPEGVTFDDLHRAGADRTTPRVVAALTGVQQLDSTPGTRYRYSNAGYVCLALVVERAAGRPFPDFAREHLFEPLAMPGTGFWAGPAPHPPGAAPTPPDLPAPLSLGDGGAWSTAADLLRWAEALDRDELGVSALLQTPGRLADGTALDYAWGMDVRARDGDAVYRHGGLWAGLTTQLVRIPRRRFGLVVIALDEREERAKALADAVVAAAAPGQRRTR